MPVDRQLSLCAMLLYPTHCVPGQRFRIEQWTPYLRSEGIGVDFFSFADKRLMDVLYKPGRVLEKSLNIATGTIRRVVQMIQARNYDAIYVSRAAFLAGPPLWEHVLRCTSRPIIYDFDDAIYLLDTSAANRSFGWLKFPGKTATLCRMSRHVVVGNATLADFARRHNSNITIIPSSVDTNRYTPSPRQQSASDGTVIVGWTGSATSQTHLEQALPLLRQLTAFPQIELRVHSDRPPHLPGVPHVWRPWSLHSEIDEIARFDIGIMPMPDAPWARGKCAMKALLYMAMGIPPVCSAVGMNCQLIQPGQNGFLAQTTAEWLRHLRELAENPSLRATLGAAARRTVEDHYSMRRCAGLFADVVRQSVAPKHSELSTQYSALSTQYSSLATQ